MRNIQLSIDLWRSSA